MTVTPGRSVEEVFAVLTDVGKVAAGLIARFYRMAFERDLRNLKAMMDSHQL